MADDGAQAATFCDLCGTEAETIKIALPEPPVKDGTWQEYMICEACSLTISLMWSERRRPNVVLFEARQ